ncbi:MAG: M28 family peptidase, partial [Isosphaeraceae bacterium]
MVSLLVTMAVNRGAIADDWGSETPGTVAVPALTPAETRLKADVSYLAADAREGRAPGTKGIEDAALYIAEKFKRFGLKPAQGADGYFQKFPLTGRPRLGEPTELAILEPDGKVLKAEPKTEFSPLAIGSSGSVDHLPIVFAGYGITAKDSALQLDYDDYAGIDVQGKAVLIIRREPQQDRDDSPFAGKKNSDYATFRHKATNAFQHGAAIVLLVNDLAGLHGDQDKVLGLVSGGPEAISKLPFAMLSRGFAGQILAAAGEPNLAELEKRIDGDLKPRSRLLKGVLLSAKLTIDRPSVETKNVVGVLEGSGPLAEETIIIGGHYDHLGRGGLMSGSLAFLSSGIHNGADDNASGTAMVMEIARRLASRRDPLPRRVVFMAFSGEERGLLGSKYYVEHPLYPLASTVMMVNFDMVGRLNGKSELTMIGTGTSPG